MQVVKTSQYKKTGGVSRPGSLMIVEAWGCLNFSRSFDRECYLGNIGGEDLDWEFNILFGVWKEEVWRNGKREGG